MEKEDDTVFYEEVFKTNGVLPTLEQNGRSWKYVYKMNCYNSCIKGFNGLYYILKTICYMYKVMLEITWNNFMSAATYQLIFNQYPKMHAHALQNAG